MLRSMPCRAQRHAAKRGTRRGDRAISSGATLDYAHSERSCDRSVRQIYATLLDEGIYVASIST